MTFFKRPYRPLSERPSAWEDPPDDDPEVDDDLEDECIMEPEDDLDFDHKEEDRDCDYWERTV